MRSYTHDLNQASNQKRSLIGFTALVCLLTLAIVTPVAAATPEVISFTRADVNNDGEVDFHDLLLAMDYMKGDAKLPVIEALDVINDGRLTEGDIFGLEHIARAPRGSGFLPERVFYIPGDLDDDGELTSRDASILELHLKKNGAIRHAPLDAADLDRNGYLDDADLAALVNLLDADEQQAATAQSSAGDDAEILDVDGEGAADGESPDFGGVSERGQKGVDKGDDGRTNPRVIDFPAPIEEPTLGGVATRGKKSESDSKGSQDRLDFGSVSGSEPRTTTSAATAPAGKQSGADIGHAPNADRNGGGTSDKSDKTGVQNRPQIGGSGATPRNGGGDSGDKVEKKGVQERPSLGGSGAENRDSGGVAVDKVEKKGIQERPSLGDSGAENRDSGDDAGDKAEKKGLQERPTLGDSGAENRDSGDDAGDKAEKKGIQERPSLGDSGAENRDSGDDAGDKAEKKGIQERPSLGDSGAENRDSGDADKSDEDADKDGGLSREDIGSADQGEAEVQ